MPNKLFEYIQAGLPVVVGSPLSAMSGVVRERGIGLTSDLNPSALASALNEICRSDRSAMLAAVKGAADEFTWENEEPRLARVYAALGARSDG
jgi:glycosyltransferase involved in cell wall biosynthesis